LLDWGDLNHLVGLAVSNLNLSRSQFYELSPVEFSKALELKRVAITEESKDLLEIIRLQTLVLVDSQRLAKDQIKNPERLWSYSWEKSGIQKNDTEVTEFTDEEAKKIEARFPVAPKKVNK
jgi:hypothetical protein